MHVSSFGEPYVQHTHTRKSEVDEGFTGSVWRIIEVGTSEQNIESSREQDRLQPVSVG